MKIYLVGGAVRDKLLGLPVREKDWVVVGATCKQMLDLGFLKVGKDFPVFLHPITKEEYALARTERKTGKGYTKFSCFADNSVTLQEDLSRRDITINAIAQTKNGKIIDPYNGIKDLKKRLFRHVSPAFVEDPVRVLRIARFAARFGEFKVHPSTTKLMIQMLKDGEIDALVPERVWQEFSLALLEEYPQRFFMVLKNCQTLHRLFPEFISSLSKILKILKKTASLTQDPIIRFVVCTSYLSQDNLISFSKRYKIPNSYTDLSLLFIKFKPKLESLKINSESLVSTLECIDSYRRPQRFYDFLFICSLFDKKLLKVSNILEQAYKITKNIKLSSSQIEHEQKHNLSKVLHLKRKDSLE